VQIDPSYARAQANLVLACWIFVAQGFAHRDDPLVEDMAEVIEKALSLDPVDSEVVALAATGISMSGDQDTGVALIEKAIALNPNNADAFRMGGQLHGYRGELDKALDYQQRAERLNPMDASWSGYVGYAIAHFAVGDHEKVVDWTARILRERPNAAPALRYRAASLALLGRMDEARQVVARILAQTPDYKVSEVRRHHEFDMNNPFKAPGVAESLYRGLQLAGLPE
jgi:tetratricopeptide (TPR) repeat protein